MCCAEFTTLDDPPESCHDLHSVFELAIFLADPSQPIATGE
jgi:hypothetical protein